MKKRYEALSVLGLCAALVAVPMVAGADRGGEARVEVDGASRRATKDVGAARLVDKSSGDTLDGTFEVTFANGKTKLNPAALNNVQWETKGKNISGRLLGPAGQELAVLTGKIGDGEMGGKFRDAAGRVGTWKFTGVLPGDR